MNINSLDLDNIAELLVTFVANVNFVASRKSTALYRAASVGTDRVLTIRKQTPGLFFHRDQIVL